MPSRLAALRSAWSAGSLPPRRHGNVHSTRSSSVCQGSFFFSPRKNNRPVTAGFSINDLGNWPLLSLFYLQKLFFWLLKIVPPPKIFTPKNRRSDFVLFLILKMKPGCSSFKISCNLPMLHCVGAVCANLNECLCVVLLHALHAITVCSVLISVQNQLYSIQ